MAEYKQRRIHNWPQIILDWKESGKSINPESEIIIENPLLG